MTGAVDPADLLAGLEPLNLTDGQHVRAVVIVALVDDVASDREASLQVVQSPTCDSWTALGMLVDAADGLRSPGWRIE